MESNAFGRILVVDDDEELRRYLRDTLTAAGYAVEIASAAEDALARLEREAPPIDLLVVDVAMPRMSGLELLGRAREREATARVPAVILSGYDDCDLKVAGLRLGAYDYLVKPVDPEELLARVDAHLRVARELEMWRRQTRFDPLTGLLNRHGFTEALEREVERATRHHTELAVAFMDLDGFKAINDRLGHAVGDEILCEVSRSLSQSLRACDVAARWGGDEFVAAFPHADRAAAELAVERVRAAVAGVRRRDQTVGISAGISCLSHERARERRRTLEGLIDAADRAMYRDKEAREPRRRDLLLIDGGQR